MHYSDYLREEAARFRAQAESASDPAVREDLLECASIYEEVADHVDGLRASG